MQIKATMRCHLAPIRMTIINKSTKNKCWRGVEKGEPSCTVAGNGSWYNHYGEQYGRTSEIYTQNSLMTSYPTLGHISGQNFL